MLDIINFALKKDGRRSEGESPEDSSDEENEYQELDDEGEYTYPDVVIGNPINPDIARMPPSFVKNQSSSDQDVDELRQDNATDEGWYGSCDVTTTAKGRYYYTTCTNTLVL